MARAARGPAGRALGRLRSRHLQPYHHHLPHHYAHGVPHLSPQIAKRGGEEGARGHRGGVTGLEIQVCPSPRGPRAPSPFSPSARSRYAPAKGTPCAPRYTYYLRLQRRRVAVRRLDPSCGCPRKPAAREERVTDPTRIRQTTRLNTKHTLWLGWRRPVRVQTPNLP